MNSKPITAVGGMMRAPRPAQETLTSPEPDEEVCEYVCGPQQIRGRDLLTTVPHKKAILHHIPGGHVSEQGVGSGSKH